jgi:hypothetical protein
MTFTLKMEKVLPPKPIRLRDVIIQKTTIYEGYSESNLQRAVNKKVMRKYILFYTKNTYIIKVILNVVTPGIEVLVLEDKFMYACIKEVCRL